MINIFNKFKKKKKVTTPEDGAIYAVHDGDCKGQMLLFVESNEEVYGALVFPEMELYEVPIKDVKEGFELGIIKYVEHLPKPIYDHCCAEYTHRKNLKSLKEEARIKKEPDEPTT